MTDVFTEADRQWRKAIETGIARQIAERADRRLKEEYDKLPQKDRAKFRRKVRFVFDALEAPYPKWANFRPGTYERAEADRREDTPEAGGSLWLPADGP